jgi:DNA anti-recombination protein RmuC
MGLRGLKIEKQAQSIQASLGRLEGDFRRFRDEYVTLGGHLERARNKYEEADRLLHRFSEKLETTRAPDPGREPALPPPES